jgi:hypothetical protein
LGTQGIKRFWSLKWLLLLSYIVPRKEMGFLFTQEFRMGIWPEWSDFIQKANSSGFMQHAKRPSMSENAALH